MDRIPKLLHLYWDKSPMSKLQVFTIETFHKLNPDWKINVYVPSQNYIGTAKYIPDYTGEDHFHIVENMSFVNIIEVNLENYGVKINIHNILRSDIFRYYILYEQGGVWSDFDVIWLKPMSHINYVKTYGNVPVNDMGAMVTFYDKTKGHHNIGILLSSPNHPLYKTFIDKTSTIQNNHTGTDTDLGHQSFGSAMWGEMYPNLYTITSNFNDVLGFKYETFAPYSIFNIEKLYLENDISPIEDNNVVGLHWFNGHSLSKDYINQNKYGDNSSMTTILRTLDYENV